MKGGHLLILTDADGDSVVVWFVAITRDPGFEFRNVVISVLGPRSKYYKKKGKCKFTIEPPAYL